MRQSRESGRSCEGRPDVARAVRVFFAPRSKSNSSGVYVASLFTVNLNPGFFRFIESIYLKPYLEMGLGLGLDLVGLGRKGVRIRVRIRVRVRVKIGVGIGGVGEGGKVGNGVE